MKTQIFIVIKACFLLIPFATFPSCSALKASPTKLAVFLPKPEVIIERRDRAPFNGYWVYDAKGYDKLKAKYKKVCLEKVDLENVVKMYEQASGSKETKQDRIEEAEQLARYFREKLKLALSMRGERAPKIAEGAEEKCLRVKLALTELVPTNPGVNFAGSVAGFLVPGGGLIKYFGEGSIAMEGYVDEKSVETAIYEQYKDREGQKTSPFTLKDYERYAHLRVAIDDWAMQIAELLSTDESVQVKDSAVISLNPL